MPAAKLAVTADPPATRASSRSPAPMARAMIACAPMPSPMSTIDATHMKLAPNPTPSSAAPAVPSGRLPARSVSVVPTIAAISCCTSTGTARIQIDSQRPFPARRPLRMIRSSSAAASAAATDSAGSPNASTSPSAASRRSSSPCALVSSGEAKGPSLGATVARRGRPVQPAAGDAAGAGAGSPPPVPGSRSPEGTPGSSKVGIAQKIR